MSEDLNAESSATGDDFTKLRDRRRHSLQHRLALRRAHVVIVIALGCGGALGAVARYAVSLAFPSSSGEFPWNTFAINVSGSAVLGFLLIVLTTQFPRGRLVRPLVGSGILGAYTTFSTLEVEALLLFRGHHFVIGISYVFASLLVGLVAVWVGMIGARFFIRVEQWLQGEM